MSSKVSRKVTRTRKGAKPAKPEKRYTLKQAEKLLNNGRPNDLDTAGIALHQAFGILDVLTSIIDGIEAPETFPGSLEQAVYAALSEVRRADEALFGPRLKGVA